MARPRRTLLASGAVSLTVLTLLAACGQSADPPAAPSAGGSGGAATSAPVVDECAKDGLAVTTPGTLTIATDNPAYPPWFVDNDPTNGKGYESAVAFAIADKLGFAADEVTWVKATFNSVIAPGKKPFDFAVNQFSISEERKAAVDFSSGYYDVRQVVVSYKGSPLEGKTLLTDLASARLGAQVGTTSYQAIVNQIKPAEAPKVFDTNDLAVQALKNKQIDGIVVDLPTGFYVRDAQLDNGVIVGQIPPASDAQEQFGAVLSKDSELTDCVTKAVDALRADKALDALVGEWLSSSGAPELS